MATRKLGIILYGVTGRIGCGQHLPHGIVAHREQPLRLRNGDTLELDPILIGRDEAKVRATAARFGITKWSTALEAALSDQNYQLFFDASVTSLRADNMRKALLAGKHVLCDKPVAGSYEQALELAQLAHSKGLKNGVMMTHLWLPGLRKLKALVDSNFFGRVLLIKGEHGYWVFDGDPTSGRVGQRPSWNSKREDGGGIVLDMMCHWHYLLETLFGPIKRVTCTTGTGVPKRWDEAGAAFAATAEDTALVLCEMASGALAQLTFTWCTRVRRDDLMSLQVDGTQGSAVAGIIDCFTQHATQTPAVVWSAHARTGVDHRQAWLPVPDLPQQDNAFQTHWSLFLRHLCEDAPFPWDFAYAARGMRLVDLCYRGAARGSWESMDV